MTDPTTYVPLTLAEPPARAVTNVCYGTQGGSGDQLVTIDPATGAATPVGSTGLHLPGLAISPGGDLYATTESSGDLYRIDAATGKAFLIGPTGVSYLDAIAFDRDGNLWGLGNTGAVTRYAIDRFTGAATPIGATGERLAGLAVDPTDGTLYASTGSASAVVPDGIYSVDKMSGAITLIGTTGLGGATPDLQFDVNGRLFGVKGGGSGGASQYIAIDKTTGAGTAIGSTGIVGVSGLASQAFLSRAPTNEIYGTQATATCSPESTARPAPEAWSARPEPAEA